MSPFRQSLDQQRRDVNNLPNLVFDFIECQAKIMPSIPEAQKGVFQRIVRAGQAITPFAPCGNAHLMVGLVSVTPTYRTVHPRK
jgi:hypothetical protein